MNRRLSSRLDHARTTALHPERGCDLIARWWEEAEGEPITDDQAELRLLMARR